MEKGYRIPDISEFVEGFEYQIPHTTRVMMMDFANPENTTTSEPTTTWFDMVVPNLDPITYPHTIENEDGSTYTFMNDSGMYDDPLEQIKRMLENGYIRTKIK